MLCDPLALYLKKSFVQTFKFLLHRYYAFRDLPFDELNSKKTSIYIIDYDWNYLYANRYAIDQIGSSVVGKHVTQVWQEHPETNFQPVFNLLKGPVTERKPVEVSSRSPLTRRAIEIIGHPLSDCYFFAISELPDKETLLTELKDFLKNRER